MPYAYPSVITSVERGEAMDSSFWTSAVANHFSNEPEWQSRIRARPVLPPEGAVKAKAVEALDVFPGRNSVSASQTISGWAPD